MLQTMRMGMEVVDRVQMVVEWLVDILEAGPVMVDDPVDDPVVGPAVDGPVADTLPAGRYAPSA